MITTFAFGGMDNVSDPATVGKPDMVRVRDRYTRCVDIVNCDIDDDAAASRRDGRALATAGNVTSAWSNGTETFCVMNRLLHTFDGANLTPVGNSPAVLPEVEFCQVNDVVAFSDLDTIGLIEDGVPYVITAPAEATDILDLETWVKLTYPAGADADDSNFEDDAFKMATLAGRCLEFFNGALYLTADITVEGKLIHFIFCTKTFNVEKMDIRYNVVAGFASPVTMIKGVNDGLFVGTEKGTHFLAGDGVAGSGPGVRGFEQRKLLPFGVVYGSAATVHADKAAALETPNHAAVWLTSDGIYAGGDGGRYVNLTAGRMTMPAGSTAAAMVRQQGNSWQYVVCVGSTTIAVNLAAGYHSRFTNYAFTAFFQRAAAWYGANPSGLFLLTGETDAGGEVDAYVLTPVVDFGDFHVKSCPDAYLHVRGAGEMIVNLFVDEVAIDGDFPFSLPTVAGSGVHRARAKLPRGIKGTSWQFRIANVDGARFTMFSLKTDPAGTNRTG
jgi:hypothetical protein